MNQGPVFIGGLDRSGKTTLRGFLQSHPAFSIPAVGSNLWSYFYRQYGDLSEPRNLERCLDAMMRYKQVRFLEPDWERLRQDFNRGPATYPRLFALLQEQHAEREGKPRWGDQTGLIERYADQVLGAYPDARMIHMLRDPRDRYAGSLQLWPSGKARAGGAAARWLYTTGLALRNLKKHPGRYIVVRFEDLVTQPERTLRTVCAFLGEEFDPRMLRMDGAPDHREKMIRRSHGDPNASPLSAEYIGIYRAQLSKTELVFLQTILRARMRRFGYSLEPIQLSPGERLDYLFKVFPANLIRLAAWLAIETVQHHFPSLFGRKPGANMLVKPPAGEAVTLAEGER